MNFIRRYKQALLGLVLVAVGFGLGQSPLVTQGVILMTQEQPSSGGE